MNSYTVCLLVLENVIKTENFFVNSFDDIQLRVLSGDNHLNSEENEMKISCSSLYRQSTFKTATQICQ